MATTSKFYSVIAGRKEPVMVLQGQLSKNSGQPQGKTQKVKVPVGAYLIPNFSRVWGKRISNKKEFKGRVTVTDPSYSGHIEFMKYGEDGGEVIEIRYLQSSGSLDKLYQDTIQKIKPSDESAFIVLQQGINNFDEETQPKLVEMLKVHSMNADSKAKDPNNIDYDYIDYNPNARNKTQIQAIVIRNAAEGYVIDAKDDSGRIRVLANIYNIDDKTQDDVIFEELLKRATEFPNEFVQTMNKYQTKIQLLMEDSVSAEVITIDPEGDLYLITDGKKEKLLTDVKGKKEERFTFIAQQVIKDAQVFDAVVEVERAYKQYQKQLA